MTQVINRFLYSLMNPSIIEPVQPLHMSLNNQFLLSKYVYKVPDPA